MYKLTCSCNNNNTNNNNNDNNNNQTSIAPYSRNFRGAGSRLDQ